MGSTVAAQIRKRCRMPGWRRCWTISSNMSAPRRMARRRCCAASRICRPMSGVWYPMGGTRAVPQALAAPGRGAGRRHPLSTGIKRASCPIAGAVSGVETEAGETVPLSAVVSNMDSVRTYRELVGGAGPAQLRQALEAGAGLFRRGALSRAWTAPTTHLAHHDFVFSRDPEEEFDCHLQTRRAGAGPDLLHRRPVAHRARRGAPRWRGAVYPGAHPLSAAAPRLGRRCCRAIAR